MTEDSYQIFKTMQVRHTKKQKATFREWLCTALRSYGYAPYEEGSSATRNVIVGDPDAASIILTAHYDTPAISVAPNKVAPYSNIITLLWTVKNYWWALALTCVLEVILTRYTLWSSSVCIWIASLPVFAISLLSLYGPANKHNANDNTSGVIALLEIAQALPVRLRSKVCFIFFDNEEKGLLGSAHFVRHHKGAKQHTPVLNFDCVGDGTSFHLIPNPHAMKFAKRASKYYSGDVIVREGKYSSDQRRFSRGVGICALNRTKHGVYYLDKIHTGKDRECAEQNIDMLCKSTLSLIEMI